MTKQLLSFPGITHMRSLGLVTKHLFHFSVDFVGIMIYLPNICFGHTHECLVTAMFFILFYFYFPCMYGGGWFVR